MISDSCSLRKKEGSVLNGWVWKVFSKRSYSTQGASIDLIIVGNYISCGDKCSQGIAPLNDNKNESRMTLGYKMTNSSGLENELIQLCANFDNKKRHPPWQVLEMHTTG